MGLNRRLESYPFYILIWAFFRDGGDIEEGILEAYDLTPPGTPQLPFKRPLISSSRDQKAINKGALNSAGWEPQAHWLPGNEGTDPYNRPYHIAIIVPITHSLIPY